MCYLNFSSCQELSPTSTPSNLDGLSKLLANSQCSCGGWQHIRTHTLLWVNASLAIPDLIPIYCCQFPSLKLFTGKINSAVPRSEKKEGGGAVPAVCGETTVVQGDISSRERWPMERHQIILPGTVTHRGSILDQFFS